MGKNKPMPMAAAQAPGVDLRAAANDTHKQFRQAERTKRLGILDTIHSEDISSILYFSLMWNMFESMCCNKDASIPKIEQTVNQLYVDGKL